MANLTSVGLTAGLGTSGTGTISTLDNFASGTNLSVNLAQVSGAAVPVGSGTQATSQRVTLATDSPGVTTLGRAAMANSLPVVAAPTATGTQTSVASSATDVTILASNTNRLGATVYNDSTQILYLLVASGTSSTTNYTVQLGPNAYYEVPFFYTGILKGLWASANGNARVTELTT